MVYLDNNNSIQSVYIPRQSVRNDASPEYATKTELENAIDNEVIRADGKYATKEDLIPYATTGWVESQDYVNSDEMESAITVATSGMATQNWVRGHVSAAIANETARTEETYQKIEGMSAYSTTNEVEGMIDNAVSGKMDTSAMSAYSTTEEVEQLISAATYDMATETWVNNQGFLTEHQSLSAYSTTVQVQGMITAATSGKQDTLVSGTNIKTINNESILGSGNIEIQSGGNYSAGTNIQIEDNVISVTGITVPTKLSDLDNDEGFITSDALSGYSTTQEMNTAIDNAVSGKVDTTTMSAYTPTSGFSTINGSAITEGGNITVEETPYSGGTNIQIEDHVISVTGITVPTKVSDLENDEGYITTADTQDFVTSGDVKTQIEDYGYITEDALSGYSTTEEMNTAIDNATSGKADTSALTSYYTSAQTDTAISNATSGLASTTYVDNSVSGKADSSAVTVDIATATAATTGWVSEQGYLTAYTESDPVFMASPASGITAQDISNWNAVTGLTIPTSNTAFTNDAGYITEDAISGKVDTSAMTAYYTSGETDTAISNATSGKQDTLISGTNIKTINNESILGSGNITIQGGGGSGETFIELTKAQYEALTAYSQDTTYIITDADEINVDAFATTGDLASYYTSAQTNTAISNAVSGKTDKVSVSSNIYRRFPRWNAQGVITGTTGSTVYEQSLNINGNQKTMLQTTNSSFGTIYAPTGAGTEGQPLLSNGSGAPVWGSYKFKFVSQSAYDALTTKDASTIYFIIDEN